MEARTGGDPIRRLALQPHPESPPTPVERIEVKVARMRSSELTLRYIVFGEIGDVSAVGHFLLIK